MSADALTIKRVEDRVIARAKGRRRPMTEDDEMVIRVLVEQFVRDAVDRPDWDEDEVVELLVACIGGIEFEKGKTGGFTLRMVAPDAGMYPDDPSPSKTHQSHSGRETESGERSGPLTDNTNAARDAAGEEAQRGL